MRIVLYSVRCFLTLHCWVTNTQLGSTRLFDIERFPLPISSSNWFQWRIYDTRLFSTSVLAPDFVFCILKVNSGKQQKIYIIFGLQIASSLMWSTFCRDMLGTEWVALSKLETQQGQICWLQNSHRVHSCNYCPKFMAQAVHGLLGCPKPLGTDIFFPVSCSLVLQHKQQLFCTCPGRFRAHLC